MAELDSETATFLFGVWGGFWFTLFIIWLVVWWRRNR